jgi:hypothetical protein
MLVRSLIVMVMSMTMTVMPMAVTVMAMTMMVVPMTVMVPPTRVFIIVIAWLAIGINIARIVIVIGWWHNDHPRDTDVNIDPCPSRAGIYSNRQRREHCGDDYAFHADLLR